jgi:ribosomal protein L37AE/L43A
MTDRVACTECGVRAVSWMGSGIALCAVCDATRALKTQLQTTQERCAWLERENAQLRESLMPRGPMPRLPHEGNGFDHEP